MHNVKIWIEAAPDIQFVGGNVMLTFVSGKTEFNTVMSRADFRKSCECGIRLLNEKEAEERRTVIALRHGP